MRVETSDLVPFFTYTWEITFVNISFTGWKLHLGVTKNVVLKRRPLLFSFTNKINLAYNTHILPVKVSLLEGFIKND